jgi:large subunit ribosomal protein L1
MPNIGRRQAANAAKVEKKTYAPAEALAALRAMRHARFDESAEVHVRLGIDPKQGEQQVRGTVTLPHGTGKAKRVAVFAEGERELEARQAGADLVGGKELVEKIRQRGSADFDVAVATPDMMRELAQIAKILGPQGLMPSPKNETVTPNVGKAVTELKRGKVAFKNDDTGNVHQALGKLSFTDAQLLENLSAFLDALKRAKPASAKGVYLKAATLTTTMGPGVPIALAS